MRRLLFLLVVSGCSGLTPAAAQAYCCKTNPAICTAICGAACCTKAINNLSSGSKSAMTPISTGDIEKELKSAKAGDGKDLAKALQAELDHRKAAPAKMKAK